MEKLAIKIEEFVATGQIQDSSSFIFHKITERSSLTRYNIVDVLRSERFIALTSLMTVHGVGSSNSSEVFI